MSLSKCTPMIFATTIATAMFAVLPVISLAQSTNYIFAPNSTFTLNAGLAGPQLFDLSGTFTLNEPPSVATVTNVVLGLTANPSNLNLNNPLTTAAGVTALLENDAFGVVPSPANQTVYESAVSPLFGAAGNNVHSITVDNNSGNVTISGIGSNDPVPVFLDGTTFEFSATATAVAVPEPTGLPVCLLLATTFFARRRRDASFTPA